VEKERLALQKLIEESQQRLRELTQTESDAQTGNAVDAARVRSLVEAGSVAEATALLGRLPCLHGTIVHGEKRGRTIGYPTANLGEWDTNEVDAVPADGIYAGWLHVDDLTSLSGAPSVVAPPSKGNHGFRAESGGAGSSASLTLTPAAAPANATCSVQYGIRLPAAISIGTNPTFDGKRSRQVEAFALDQQNWIDLYEKQAKIEFVSFLRPTIKFSGASWLEDLLEQMKQDCAKASAILAQQQRSGSEKLKK